MIQVKVDKMFLSNMGFVVLLKGDSDPRSLPIFIGAAEAHAIALWINRVELPRPLTHDLLKNILDCMETRVHRILINDINEGTFFARIIIDIGGSETDVDSRPSDAIAIALRTGAPIYVSKGVMDEAGRQIDIDGEGDASAGQGAPEKSELEQLKEGLEKAVSEERYEDAAGLRDRIRQIEHNSSSN